MSRLGVHCFASLPYYGRLDFMKSSMWILAIVVLIPPSVAFLANDTLLQVDDTERGYVTIAPDYTLLGDNQNDPEALG